MKCSGCFKQFEAGEKAYATTTGSIAEDPMFDEAVGFYMNDIEPWLSVLCEDCGKALHKFIAGKLEAKKLAK